MFGPHTARSGLHLNNFGARYWIPYLAESDLFSLLAYVIYAALKYARKTVHIIKEGYSDD